MTTRYFTGLMQLVGIVTVATAIAVLGGSLPVTAKDKDVTKHQREHRDKDKDKDKGGHNDKDWRQNHDRDDRDRHQHRDRDKDKDGHHDRDDHGDRDDDDDDKDWRPNQDRDDRDRHQERGRHKDNDGNKDKDRHHDRDDHGDRDDHKDRGPRPVPPQPPPPPSTLSCLCWNTYTPSTLVNVLTSVAGVPWCIKSDNTVSLTADDAVMTLVFANNPSTCMLRVNGVDAATIFSLTPAEATQCLTEAAALVPLLSWCS